jgi:hypothetical protein
MIVTVVTQNPAVTFRSPPSTGRSDRSQLLYRRRTHITLNTVLAVVSFILNFPSPLSCLLIS